MMRSRSSGAEDSACMGVVSAREVLFYILCSTVCRGMHGVLGRVDGVCLGELWEGRGADKFGGGWLWWFGVCWGLMRGRG